MNEMIELEATLDSPKTAQEVSKLLNSWFSWIMDGSDEDNPDLEDMFNEFGLSVGDYILELSDVDWNESPEAHTEGSTVIVTLDSKAGLEIVQEVIEAVGGDNIVIRGEEE